MSFTAFEVIKVYLILTSQTVWLYFLKRIFPHLRMSKNKCYKHFSKVIYESDNCMSCLAFIWYFYDDCRWMFEDVETSVQFSSQVMRCNSILTWNRWATSFTNFAGLWWLSCWTRDRFEKEDKGKRRMEGTKRMEAKRE